MNIWKETRLKNLLVEPLLYGLNASTDLDDKNLPRYIRITDFDDNNALSDDTFKSMPLSIAHQAWLKEGDLLFARSGATVGKTFLYHDLPYGACFAGYLIRARFNKDIVLPEFVSYYTKSYDYDNWKNTTYVQATIQNLSAERYYQMPIRIPSLSIQRKIVDYLNSQVATIDSNIITLVETIDAYRRLKNSIIHDAITKGLNSSTEMKDSGVSWIGQVPSHWNILRLKDIATYINGYAFKPEDWLDNGVPIVRIQNLTNPDAPFNYYQGEIPSKIVIEKGDILISWSASLGVYEWEGDTAYLNQHIFKVLFDKMNIDKSYFKYNISYLLEYMAASLHGSTMMHIQKKNFDDTKIVIAPISEQMEISHYLDSKCSDIDSNIKNINDQIEALKALKKSLINEVITGKRAV